LNPNDHRNRPQPGQFETMNSVTNESSKPIDTFTPHAAGRVVLIYAVFASLWILLSDGVLVWLVNDPSRIAFFSTVKGWLFVGVTSLLLFGLIQRLLNHVLSLSRREREAQAESSKNQQLLAAIAHNSSDAIFVKDLDGRYLLFNQAAERITGKAGTQVLGFDDTALFPPEQAQRLRANDRQMLDADLASTYEERILTVEGERTYLATKGPLRDSEGRLFGLFGISRDITGRKQAEEELRIAATAFESQLGMMVTNEHRVILRVNQAFADITGYSAQEAVGQTPRMLSSGRHDASFYAGMWEEIATRGSWQGEIWNRRKGGDVYPEWLTITAVKDQAGLTTHYVATFSDITSRKTAEDEIRNLAFYDPLTRLPNRRLLMDRLGLALSGGPRHRRKVALLFVDLDNFKTLNDTQGHYQGDLLLQQVASRLAACVREGDTVARLGGDEFVVMLGDLDNDPLEAATEAKAVGEIILAAIAEPYQLTGTIHHSTASIGVTFLGDQHENIDEPLKRADLAMYQAKTAGRNTLRFFDTQMQAIVSARAAMEADLRHAVANKQFLLHYQAQIEEPNQLVGAEALVRWEHPLRGLVPPAEFIPMAEETGLILPLGHWVLEAACAQLTRWASQPAMAHLTMSVNVSARQFHQDNFVDQVLAVLARTGANPQRLKLELTESVLIADIEGVIAKMTLLKGKGVGFALDDFGTGYSSLSYLKRLPLDQLKIDQGFVRDILHDANDAAIARMVLALADSLGLSVIAEGVETELQRDFLARLGCDSYQGYLFGRPLPIEAFESSLQRG
jgi:diguanylate cyclase (GGDEF)-like protein/PAS domain S-box-containing protein